MRGTLRSLPLLALMVLALAASPAAAAEGGSAACVVPYEIARTQPLGELRLERGPYKITVLDTSDDLTCADAHDKFRRILREPGADLPDGWKLDAASRVISRDDDRDRFRVEADDIEAVAGKRKIFAVNGTSRVLGKAPPTSCTSP